MRSAIGLAVLGFIPALFAQEPYVDPGLKKIAQVAIVCKDIEACNQRWAKLLGVAPAAVRTTKPGLEQKVIFRGQPSNAQVKLAFFKSGDVVIELLQPVGGPSSWQEYLDQNGEGVQHLGFQVADLEKTLASLKQQGMTEVHRGRYDSNDGSYVYMDSKDKLGVMIELLHSDKPAK